MPTIIAPLTKAQVSTLKPGTPITYKGNTYVTIDHIEGINWEEGFSPIFMFETSQVKFIYSDTEVTIINKLSIEY